MSYFIERISEKNIDAFIEIMKSSWGKIPPVNYYINKFNTAYTGITNVGFIAFDSVSKSPAAFYGVFPHIMSFNKTDFVVAQSGDTVTHPEHRRKGLFKLLFNKTLELCKKENICMIYGFPNQSSYPGFIKFGWTHPFNSYAVNGKIKISLYNKIKKKIFKKNFYAEQNKSIRPHIMNVNDYSKINFNNSLVTENNSYCIKRTPEFLRYKSSLGSKILSLNSGHIWVNIHNNQIEIGDMFGDTLSELFEETIHFCKLCGIESLSIKSSVHLNPLDYFGNYLSNVTRTQAEPLVIYRVNNTIPLDPGKFLYTSGDYDTF